jgi:hypothetical protein
MHETILLVLPNRRFGNSSDFIRDTSPSVEAAIPATEGSMAAVVVTAAVCKNFRRVTCVFILFLFDFSLLDFKYNLKNAGVIYMPVGNLVICLRRVSQFS